MKLQIFTPLFFASGLLACDAGFSDFRADVPAGLQGDGGAVDPDAVLRAAGRFTGRADYAASGTAQLFQNSDGSSELRFSDDFSVSRVPGPVVVLSTRPSLGSSIQMDADDVELGTLPANSGALRFSLPMGTEDRRYVWVYCKPFGLEVGRAELEEVDP